MKKTILFSIISCLFLCMLLSGCAAVQGADWREYKVFCGLSSEQGEVSEAAWSRFCDQYVSAAFPDGYTVLDASGYWRSGSDLTAKERSKVILIVAPASAKEKVLLLARQFRHEFDQNAVLVSCSGIEADLVTAKDTRGK